MQRFGRLVAPFHSGVLLCLQLDPRGFSRTTEADGEAGSGDRLVEQASTVATDAMRSEFLRFCDLCTGVSVQCCHFTGMRVLGVSTAQPPLFKSGILPVLPPTRDCYINWPRAEFRKKNFEIWVGAGDVESFAKFGWVRAQLRNLG